MTNLNNILNDLSVRVKSGIPDLTNEQHLIKLFDVLKEKNYSGWLVVEAEQDPKKANPLEYAIKGYKYLNDTLKKSEIEIDKC